MPLTQHTSSINLGVLKLNVVTTEEDGVTINIDITTEGNNHFVANLKPEHYYDLIYDLDRIQNEYFNW